jgi:hypothetical protein
LTYADANVQFATVSNPIGRAEDSIWNCLAYNYSDGFNASFMSDHDLVNAPVVNQLPQFFSDPIITERLFDIEEVMLKNLQTSPYSICKKLGNNNKLDDLVTDILGFDRIFDRGIVDIGPYSIILFKKFFFPKDIYKIFQEKLEFIPSDSPAEEGLPLGTIRSKVSGLYYNWLAADLLFLQIDIEKYCRESKIFFEMKPDTADFRTFSDKTHKLIAVLEAHYDKTRNTIVITKTPDYLGGLFDSTFEDGRFVFFLNEEESNLYVYEINTYDKSASGQRNIVNNVRFGGTSVVS